MVPEDKTEDGTKDQITAELEDMYRRAASIEKTADPEDPGEEIPLHPREEITPSPPETVAPGAAGSRETEIPQALLRSRRRRGTRGGLAAVLVCVCVLAFGVFFWPTLYDVAMIHQDGRLYPLRVNRITGDVLYFDGQQWRDTPIPTSKSSVPGTPLAAAPPTVSSAPAPAVPPAASPPAVQTKTQPQNNALPDRRHAPAPPSSRMQRKESSVRETGQKPSREGRKDAFLAIQIRAYANPDEAKKLVEELRKKGLEADHVPVTVGTRGVLNRVLIGQFRDSAAALRFMRDKKIKEAYPDSFIQKRLP